MVVISAYCQALVGVAKHIGASMTSGGTGKNDDSAKLNSPKYLGAFGSLDHEMAFSNKVENIFILVDSNLVLNLHNNIYYKTY